MQIKRKEENGREYELIRSARRTLAVEIRQGRVIVRAPRTMPRAEIERFLGERKAWIEAHVRLSEIRRQPAGDLIGPEEIRRLTEEAKRDIPPCVETYAARMGVAAGKITIRHQKTRWGSCTAKGNLNFNCLLMLCPEAVRDYVVVHELCHRKEMNHSDRFWLEVQSVMPDFARHRQWLKENGGALIQRMEEGSSRKGDKTGSFRIDKE